MLTLDAHRTSKRLVSSSFERLANPNGLRKFRVSQTLTRIHLLSSLKCLENPWGSKAYKTCASKTSNLNIPKLNLTKHLYNSKEDWMPWNVNLYLLGTTSSIIFGNLNSHFIGHLTVKIDVTDVHAT